MSELCSFLDARFIPKRIESVASSAETKSVLHQLESALKQMILLRADWGQLHLPFTFNRRFRERVGFSNTSKSRFNPNAKSELRTSTFNPKLLLPPKESMLPPTDSICDEISSAVRDFVPLISSRAVSCVSPFRSGCSTSTPPLKTARNSTKGSR